MKFDNHRKFRYELVKVLKKSKISPSPLREDFISLSWRKYKSQNRKSILFDTAFKRAKYRNLRKTMLKEKTWGCYLSLMTDGDLTMFL